MWVRAPATVAGVCGRFVSSSPPDELARYFDAEPPAERLEEAAVDPAAGPNFNVAPSTGVYVVRSDGSVRHLDRFRWGLVPSWAKDVAIGNKMINARMETVGSKPAFRRALAKRRCIVPADGFYEWTTVPGQKKKQPWFIHRPDGEPYAFAGLWEVWRAPATEEGDPAPRPWLRSCTIITGPANERMAKLHDRMPVMLPPSAWDLWLDPTVADIDLVGRLLVPAGPEVIAFHPVTTDVNNVRNNGSHLLDVVDVAVVDG